MINTKEAETQELNRKKLEEIVLYACSRCSSNSLLGRTKLHKILWYSDVIYFANTGKSITGETYIKRQYGPTSKHLLEITKKLESESALITRKVKQIDYPKKEYIPMRDPDISGFTPDEISLIDQVVHVVCYEHTAESISLASHNKIWELAEIGEEIPLYTVYGWNLGEINEQDMAWAKHMLASSK